MDFNFYMPSRIISGKNTVSNNEDIFTQYGSKCLIITGGSSAEQSGAFGDVTAVLKKKEIEFTIFNEITQNPKAVDCHKAGQLARDFAVDFIIGIGGGSVLDASKAVAVYATNRHLEAEAVYSGEIMLSPLPLILVGTTAGTGSEVTGVAVLTRENGKKKSVSGKNYYSAVSFADPRYTYSVPYSFTVSTAIDAFSHATESFFSNKAERNSYMYAKSAIVPLFDALKYFYETEALPDEAMRDELYYSSLSAGMAINITGTCFPHTLGYTLTEDYDLHHGIACSVFLPKFIKRAMKFKNELSMNYFSILGTNYPELEKIISTLAKHDKIIMTQDQIDAYCKGLENVKNFTNSPGGFTQMDAKNLLSDMFS